MRAELILFTSTVDTKFSKLFSGKPASKEDLDEGVSLTEFKDVFATGSFPSIPLVLLSSLTLTLTFTGNLFAAGMSISYAGNLIVARADGTSTVKSRPELAPKLAIGERFFSAQVVNIASATPDQLATRMLTNGAFRVLVFAGNVAEEKAMKRLEKLAEYLDGEESVVSKFTPKGRSRSSVIDVITIRESLFVVASNSK